MMTFIRGIEVTRDDGRSWTFPICRSREFDVSLAVMDAMQQRGFAHGEAWTGHTTKTAMSVGTAHHAGGPTELTDTTASAGDRRGRSG